MFPPWNGRQQTRTRNAIEGQSNGRLTQLYVVTLNICRILKPAEEFTAMCQSGVYEIASVCSHQIWALRKRKKQEAYSCAVKRLNMSGSVTLEPRVGLQESRHTFTKQTTSFFNFRR